MKPGLKQTLALALFIALVVLMCPATAATTDIVEGNPDATVKVTIFSDLQCDYCQSLRTMLDEKLLPKYGKEVAFIHRDMPLPRHDWARSAAMAARWVHEQNPRLSPVFRRELLAEQEHITKNSLKSWVIEFASRNKLSEQGIVAAMSDTRLGAQVDRDTQMGSVRGVKKLPAVYVGGQTFVETIVYDDIARVLDQELSRSASARQ
jgi:protein-disulfide isomerase